MHKNKVLISIKTEMSSSILDWKTEIIGFFSLFNLNFFTSHEKTPQDYEKTTQYI